MPELPDVQVFRECLETDALGQRIATVSVRASGMLEDVSARSLRAALKGHELEATHPSRQTGPPRHGRRRPR